MRLCPLVNRTDQSGLVLLQQMHMKKYRTATMASLTIWLMVCSSSTTSAFDMLVQTKRKKSGAQCAVGSASATHARHCDMLWTAPSHSLHAGADAKNARVTLMAVLSSICAGGTRVHV